MKFLRYIKYEGDTKMCHHQLCHLKTHLFKLDLGRRGIERNRSGRIGDKKENEGRHNEFEVEEDVEG